MSTLVKRMNLVEDSTFPTKEGRIFTVSNSQHQSKVFVLTKTHLQLYDLNTNTLIREEFIQYQHISINSKLDMPWDSIQQIFYTESKIILVTPLSTSEIFTIEDVKIFKTIPFQGFYKKGGGPNTHVALLKSAFGVDLPLAVEIDLEEEEIQGAFEKFKMIQNTIPEIIPFEKVKPGTKALKSSHVTVIDFNRKGIPDFLVRDAEEARILSSDGTVQASLKNLPGPYSPMGENELVLYGNITGRNTGKYGNFLIRNYKGLYLYECDENLNCKVVNYNPMFSQVEGWDHPSLLHSLQLEDVNEDGLEELVFTGPTGLQILSFNNQYNEWEPIFDNNDLEITNRYARVCATAVVNSNSRIITKTPMNQIQLWKIIPKDPEKILPELNELDVPFSRATNTEQIPASEFKIGTNPVPVEISLKDSVDYSSIMKNSVDVASGRVRLQIPLMDAVSRLFNFMTLSYDSGSKDSFTVGQGWSLPEQYIVLDDQGSVFPTDHKYLMVVQELILELFPIAVNKPWGLNKPKEKILKFSFTNPKTRAITPDDVIVTYDTEKEIWVVPKKDVNYIYGSEDATIYDVTWNNYRGRGNSPTNLIRIPKIWNLAQIIDVNGKTVLDLHYINIQEEPSAYGKAPAAAGLKLTRQCYLESAQDIYGNKLKLTYKDKDPKEYNLEKDMIKDGNFEKYTYQGKYLASYSLSGSKYSQSIDLGYEIKDNVRVLTKIAQSNQTVFVFKYNADKKMTDLSVPGVVDLHHKFTSIQGDPKYAGANIALKFRVFPKFQQLPDAIMITYLSQDDKTFKLLMYTADGTELKDDLSPLFESTHTWNDYQVVVSDNMLTVIGVLENEKEIYFLCKDKSSKWSVQLKRSQLSKDTTIKSGLDYVLYNIPGKQVVTFVHYKNYSIKNEENDFLQLDGNNEIILATADNFYVIGAKKSEIYIQRNGLDFWYGGSLDTKGIELGNIGQFRDALARFSDLTEERKASLLKSFKESTLSIHDNLIYKTQVELSTAGVLKSYVHMIRIDENLKSIQVVTSEPLVRNLLEMDSKFGDTEFKYLPDGFRKYKIDPSVDTYKNVDTLIQWGSFIAEYKDNKLHFGGQTFSFDGSQLKTETVVKPTEKEASTGSVKMNDNLVLEYEGGEFKIKNKGQLIQLGCNQISQLRVQLPSYLACQTKEGLSIGQLTQLGDILYKYKYSDELPTEFLTAKSLITVKKKLDSNKNTVFVIRPMEPLTDTTVVSSQLIQPKGSWERETGYDYTDPKSVGTTANFAKTTVIPGNNDVAYGTIEYNNPHDPKQNASMIYFNNEKKMVYIENRSEQESNPAGIATNAKLKQATITDTEGQVEIMQAFPYNQANDEVDYFGFEVYEQDLKKRQYPRKGVESCKFSRTGNNCLRLSGDEGFSAFYSPEDQDKAYKMLTWVRVASKLGLESVSPIAKALIYNGSEHLCTFLSNVKIVDRVENWYLLQTKIDLPLLRKLSAVPKSIIVHDQAGLKKVTSSTKFGISLQISPNGNEPIDVDHVYFAPFHMETNVMVYDPSLWKLTNKISSTGMIKSYIYDEMNNELCKVKEDNQVDSFSSFSVMADRKNITGIKPLSIIEVTGSNGYYETFSPESFSNMWMTNLAEPWELYPSMLRHSVAEGAHSISSITKILSNSIAVRFRYSVENENSQIIINSALKITSTTVSYGTTSYEIDKDGEIIVVSDGGRLFVLIGGTILMDNLDATDFIQYPFSIMMYGLTSIRDLIMLRNPTIAITHINPLGEAIQKVHLIENGSAIIRAYQIDAIGRKIRENFPEKISPKIGETLLGFDVKKLPNEKNKHRKVVYFNDPTNDVKHVAIFNAAGKNNSGTVKNYLRALEKKQLPGFLLATYSLWTGEYRYQVEQKPGMIRDVNVFNPSRQMVARYTYSETDLEGGVLSTYLYTEDGQQRAVLPPEAYSEQSQRQNLLHPSEDQLKKGVVMSYNSSGQHRTLKSCDAGKRENIFNTAGKVKFQISYDIDNDSIPSTIVYYNYDNLQRLESTGYIRNPKSKNSTFFSENLEVNVIPDGVEFQRFEYTSEDASPYLSNRIQRVITLKSEGEEYPHVEQNVANIYKKVVSSRIYLPTKSNQLRTLEITQRFRNMETVSEIQYPYEYKNAPLKVKYTHDKLDRIASIKVNQKILVQFEYDAEGLISRQVFSPGSKTEFDRKYELNQLGLYTLLSDKFLDEKIEYTERSSGELTIIDGSIASTKFVAKWQKFSDQTQQLLTEDQFLKKSNLPPNVASLCHKALQTTGVIDSNFQQTRLFSNIYDPQIPFICAVKSDDINNALGKESFQNVYGHRYGFSYNNELQSAKYYVGDHLESESLLTQKALAASTTNPKQLWNNLIKDGFIVEFFNRLESNEPFAKLGTKSFLDPQLLDDLLKAKPLLTTLAIHDQVYLRPLEDFILVNYIKNVVPSNFQLKTWFQNQPFANAVDEALQRRRNPINPDLKKHFTEDSLQTGIGILYNHLYSHAMPSQFDVEAYAVSLNGNHKHFRTGYQHFKLEYIEGTNKISNITSTDDLTGEVKSFNIKHDSQGNIIQAHHKNIEEIKYHPVLNKPSEIVMSDGKVIKYSYNLRSDRISKRVYTKDNHLLAEVSYVRDDQGRSLVEREILHLDRKKEPLITVTAYVYADKGLIGFFRNDNYYNVLKDHEGSIRLVEKNGAIVAAYDYYPYGGLMRKFETDADSKISYRYTGYEYDPETGLYYAIARLYDPEIGRFYQMDPKAQYFSSYKYSGNSPVSMVDPDGEFAMLIATVVCGVVGAYLGGAAANDSWLPWEWDFTNSNTYIGMAEGALWGAMIPTGFAGSVAAVSAYTSKAVAVGVVAGVGLAASYWDGYRRAGTWDITKWNYTDPTLYFNMFTGFADVGIVGDVLYLRKIPKLIGYLKGLSTFKKIAYAGTVSSIFAFESYVAAGNHNYDLMDPDTIKDILNGIITMPFDARSTFRKLKTVRDPWRSAKAFVKTAVTKGIVSEKKLKKTMSQIGEIFVSGGGATKNTIKATSFAIAFSKTKTIVQFLDSTLNAAGSKMYTTQITPKWTTEDVEERRWQTAVNTQVMQKSSSKHQIIQPAPQWDDFVSNNQKIIPILNSRSQEAVIQFRKIQSQLKSDMRDDFGVVSEQQISALLEFIERRLIHGQAFILDLGKSMRKAMFKYFHRLSQKVSKTPTERALLKYVRSVYQFEKMYWETNQLGAQLEQLNNIVSSVPSIVPYTTKVSSQCAEALRSTYYKPANFLYTDSVEFVYAEPFEECFICPETTTQISTNSLTLSNILAEDHNVTSALFFEPPPCTEEKLQRKRRSTVFKGLGDCLSFLNTTTTAMISTFKEGVFNKTETFTPDYSMANMSSTLLLFDTCLRKLTGEKYKAVGKGEMTLNKAQEMAVNIVIDVETVLKEEILEDNEEFLNDIDFAGLQCEVFKAIVEDRKSKVLDIIWNSMKGSMEKLSAKETANLQEYFNKNCQETKNM